MKKLNLVLALMIFGLSVSAEPAVRIKSSKDCWQKGDSILLTAYLYGFTDKYQLQWQVYEDNNWHRIKNAICPNYMIIGLKEDQPFRVVVKEKGNSPNKGQIFYSNVVSLTLCSVSPVTVAYFKGFVKNDQVQLSFLVSNVREIYLQASVDVHNFMDRVNVTGKNLFVDTDVVGTNYYRLRLIGENEKISYSDILMLRNGVNVSEPFIFKITNSTGQVLKTTSCSPGKYLNMADLMKEEAKDFRGILQFSFWQNGRLKETKYFSDQL